MDRKWGTCGSNGPEFHGRPCCSGFGKLRYTVGKGRFVAAGNRRWKLQCVVVRCSGQDHPVPVGLSMRINGALADILDETVKALSDLDSGSLQALEQRIAPLAESNEVCERDDAGLVLSKKRLLQIVLQNCQVNLDALTRLPFGNMRNQSAQ